MRSSPRALCKHTGLVHLGSSFGEAWLVAGVILEAPKCQNTTGVTVPLPHCLPVSCPRVRGPAADLAESGVGEQENISCSMPGICPSSSPILRLSTGLPHTLVCGWHFFSPKSLCAFTGNTVSLLSCVPQCPSSQDNSYCSSMDLLLCRICRNFLHQTVLYPLPVSSLLEIYDLLIFVLISSLGPRKE